MRSSFKPKESKAKTVTFIDYPAGRPPGVGGYHEDARPTDSEFLTLPYDEIQHIEGPILSPEVATKTTTPIDFKDLKDLLKKIAIEVADLDEEYKVTPLRFNVNAERAAINRFYSDTPAKRKFQKYNRIVEIIVTVPLCGAADNSCVLAYLKRECSYDSKIRDLEDAYNNLVMEKPDDGTDMKDCLIILRDLYHNQNVIFSEKEFYQIEKAWRLLFRLRCEHLYGLEDHQMNEERLEYIDSQIKKLEVKPSQSLSSALTGSPIRISGDAYTLLVRQINALLAQDSCDAFLEFNYEISRRDFGMALRSLCFEDVKKALPPAELVLQAKSSLNLDMKEINVALLHAAQAIKKHGDRSLYDLFVAAGADENTRDKDHSAKEYLEEALSIRCGIS